MADYIRPTPRNPILGLLSDALTGGVEWMRSPQRAQQMQGLGGLLAETGIPATVERLSYGEPLTTGRGMTTRLRPEAEAALMTLAPEAVPIGRAAMAGVRATKGLPVGAATVYHGSPYRFQRFDPTKIGSGEGAQAYGYGHYVAESPGVAATYRDMLAGKEQDIVNNAIQRSVAFGNSPRDALILEGFPKDKISPDLEKSFRKIVEGTNADGTVTNAAIREYQNLKKLVPAEGSLYTIDLPDPAIARMLDWDKPLSQQPDIVKSINPQSLGLTYKKLENGNHAFVNSEGQIIGNLQRGGTQESFTKNWTEDVLRGTGSDLYRQLGQGMEGGPKVSSALRQAGIPGIRYLDQGSRSNFRVQNTYKGEPYGEPVSFMTEKQARDYAAEQMEKGFGTNIIPGTSNFVVFPGEEDLLRILNVEGGLLGP